MRRVKQPETICWVVDLGRIPYEPACELQHQLVRARKSHTIPDVLLICEHPHVITLGRNGTRDHLQADEVLLEQMHVEFHSTDRGGDITYHGPGQVVGYPILDLTEHRRLEELLASQKLLDMVALYPEFADDRLFRRGGGQPERRRS